MVEGVAGLVSASVLGVGAVVPLSTSEGIPLAAWYPAGAKPDGTLLGLQQIARRRYDAFMNYCLTQEGMPAGMPAGAYRIKAPNQGFHPTFTLNATVSEGIGYGMLLTAWMSNPRLPADVRVTNSQAVFDGLWTYYKHFRNVNGLMNWHINPDGTVAATGGASDGDFDVAMALVVAHRMWGSDGTTNYGADATALINKIRDFEFTPTTYTGVGGPNVMMNGDQWGVDTDRYMPDYFRPGFFREFHKHTGDARWLDIIAKNYPIALGHFWINFTGGVVPDGCTRASLANGAEAYTTGYNAVRWWGIVADYLWNGTAADALSQGMSDRMVTKAKTHWPLGGDVKAPVYDLNLAGPFETFGNGAGDSMFALASLVSGTHSTWAAEVLASIDTDTEQSYFNNGLAAMAAMLAAGIAQPSGDQSVSGTAGLASTPLIGEGKVTSTLIGMVRPVVSPIADETYEGLGPYTAPDAEYGYALLRYVASTANLLQPVEDVIRDQPDAPGWSVMFDPEHVPVESLEWLGQFLGVEPVVGLTAEARRARLRETAGFQRGTVASIAGAARQFLVGGRQVLVYERDGGSAYQLRVRTYLAETPDPSAVRQAIMQQKPAGIVLVYDVASGASYEELGATFGTYSILDANFLVYEDQTLWVTGTATGIGSGTFKVRI